MKLSYVCGLKKHGSVEDAGLRYESSIKDLKSYSGMACKLLGSCFICFILAGNK